MAPPPARATHRSQPPARRARGGTEQWSLRAIPAQANLRVTRSTTHASLRRVDTVSQATTPPPYQGYEGERHWRTPCERNAQQHHGGDQLRVEVSDATKIDRCLPPGTAQRARAMRNVHQARAQASARTSPTCTCPPLTGIRGRATSPTRRAHTGVSPPRILQKWSRWHSHKPRRALSRSTQTRPPPRHGAQA